MSALPKTTSHGGAFSKGSRAGTTGNESAAITNYPIERGNAPKANAQPAYGAKKHTEYGTKPYNLGSVTNAGRDSV